MIEKSYAYHGGDGSADLQIIDLQDRIQAVPISLCQRPNTLYEADLLEFEGFMASAELFVSCQMVYSPDEEWTEVVDLTQLSSRRASLPSTPLETYGTVVNPAGVQKRQVFSTPY